MRDMYGRERWKPTLPETTMKKIDDAVKEYYDLEHYAVVKTNDSMIVIDYDELFIKLGLKEE